MQCYTQVLNTVYTPDGNCAQPAYSLRYPTCFEYLDEVVNIASAGSIESRPEYPEILYAPKVIEC